MGSPPLLPLILFVLTYIGLALGRIPGLALDRTGFAVLGAVAFLATGSISIEDAKAAVDAPTIVVLFGMMLLSAQYRQPETGYAMALSSTFAGNAVLVGSIANLIVAEQAGRLGIKLGFREHIGVGLPVTLISLALAAVALLI